MRLAGPFSAGSTSICEADAGASVIKERVNLRAAELSSLAGVDVTAASIDE